MSAKFSWPSFEFSKALVPVLVVLLTAAAFLIGVLWTKISYLERGTVAGVGNGTGSKGSGTAPSGPQAFGSADQVEKLKDSDHVRGSRDARVLLIEYSDLECPFCRRFHPTAKQIVDAYDGQVAWVYRHFPLDQLHSKADKEAEAVECAAEIGGNDGFWKLTDKIFEVTPANNGLNLDDLPALASGVGLNQNRFKQCLDSGRFAAHVEEDYQSGIKAGVSGTPGNILLDTKTGKTKLIPGALPLDSFKIEIDSMLKAS